MSAGCQADILETTNPACVTGRTGPLGPVVLFGDSHAAQWATAVEDLAAGLGTSVLMLTHSGCPASETTPPEEPRRRAGLRHLAGEHPAPPGVRSAPRARRRVEHEPVPRDAQARSAAWRPTLGRLVALGVPVVYVADTPKPDRDVPSCVSGAIDDWSRCSFARDAALLPDLVAQDVAAGRWPRTYLVDVSALVCPATGPDPRCPAVRGGVLLYRDASHLTDTAVGVLSPQFVAAVRAQLG